jgi:MFS family permease
VLTPLGSVITQIHRGTGGPEQTRVIALFACVLALESADLATVGAVAPQLQAAFAISETQLGLLAAVSMFIGALATIPFGVLVDRVTRTRILVGAVLIWAATMAVGAAAPDYQWLLVTRVGLGAVTAAAWPTIASLTGDLFPAAERGRVYGFVLSGELFGAAIGYVACGSVAGALSWRWGFGVLAPPAVLLALAVWRLLEEPARGGRDRLLPAGRATGAEAGRDGNGSGEAREAVAEQHVEPVPSHVLASSARDMSLPHAVRYVLSIPTNRWLIASSAIGYFFFAGLRTFASCSSAAISRWARGPPPPCCSWPASAPSRASWSPAGWPIGCSAAAASTPASWSVRSATSRPPHDSSRSWPRPRWRSRSPS